MGEKRLNRLVERERGSGKKEREKDTVLHEGLNPRKKRPGGKKGKRDSSNVNKRPNGRGLENTLLWRRETKLVIQALKSKRARI